MLTAMSEDKNKIDGLKIGADDYLGLLSMKNYFKN